MYKGQQLISLLPLLQLILVETLREKYLTATTRKKKVLTRKKFFFKEME